MGPLGVVLNKGWGQRRGNIPLLRKVFRKQPLPSYLFRKWLVFGTKHFCL